MKAPNITQRPPRTPRVGLGGYTLSDVSTRQFAERDLTAFLMSALQREHPEWVQTDGDCPSCRDYAAKLQTARFYFARLYPETAMLIRQARSGSANLLSLEADLF